MGPVIPNQVKLISRENKHVKEFERRSIVNVSGKTAHASYSFKRSIEPVQGLFCAKPFRFSFNTRA